MLPRLVAFEHGRVTGNGDPVRDTLVIWSPNKTRDCIRILLCPGETACQRTRVRNPALLRTNPAACWGLRSENQWEKLTLGSMTSSTRWARGNQDSSISSRVLSIRAKIAVTTGETESDRWPGDWQG